MLKFECHDTIFMQFGSRKCCIFIIAHVQVTENQAVRQTVIQVGQGSEVSDGEN